MPELAAALPRLKRLLPKFRKLRLGVLGDLMLDRFVLGEANRLSPEVAVPVVDYVSQQDFAGGAGNVAANLRALGANVEAFGVIGSAKSGHPGQTLKLNSDEAGDVLRLLLRKNHIGEHGVLADPDRITTLKTRIIARHHQIVRIDHERRDPLSPKTEEKLFRLVVAALKNLDALVLSDYDKGLFTDSLADRVLNAAHKAHIPVFVKPKTSRLLVYRGARVIVCNAKEAGHYVNRHLSDEKSAEEAGSALLPHFGCAAVVITRGEKGMSIFEESTPRHLHIPATSRPVFDVTGAGDTVLSVISLAIAAGASLPEAALLANTAAGVVVGKRGTTTVSPEELAAALDDIQG